MGDRPARLADIALLGFGHQGDLSRERDRNKRGGGDLRPIDRRAHACTHGLSCKEAKVLPIFAIVSATSVPFEPVNSWQLQADESYCVLSHDFAAADRRLSIAFRPSFGGGTVDLIIVSPGSAQTDDGYARLQFGGKSVKAPYATALNAAGTATMFRITAAEDFIDSVLTGGSVQIDAGKRSWTLRLPPGGKARTALTECEQKLISVDYLSANPPVKSAGAMTSDLRRLFGNPNNYPAAAAKAGISGSVETVLTISDAGRVEHCKAVSSAHPLLSGRTCELARQVRFTPAVDAAGKPVASRFLFRFRWVLPGG